MEKTIRELAVELNISKEAIYRKLNHSMKDELAGHAIKRDGKTFITDIGQSIIFQSLKRDAEEADETETANGNERLDAVDVVNNTVTNPDASLSPEYVKHLEKELDLLQTRYDDEITNNRRERDTLYQLNQSLIDTFKRGQHLQMADKQLQLVQTEYTPPEPKGFFGRIFKKLN